MSVEFEVASTFVERFTNSPGHTLTVVRYRRPGEHGIFGEFWTCECEGWSTWLDLDPTVRRDRHRPEQTRVRMEWNSHRRGAT